ncbi:DUF1774-domain-containing protein [Viridothelium virens]|uniref:DUF1774-domain-containing protein n=1 Tax=Viridothelium virens TaxID=1048519 RepID=A0A6A6HFW2_VIRVR|nr:DUF1774-domain-containing protein [Viridothelium virens]
MPDLDQIMDHVQHRIHAVNPFQSRAQPSPTLLTTYRILTPLALIVALIPAIHYTITSPRAGAHPSHRSIWHQNDAHPTPFALFSPLTATYWLLLYLLQAGYCTQLYTRFGGSSSSSHTSSNSNSNSHCNSTSHSNSNSHDDTATATNVSAAMIGLAPHVVAHLLLHLVFVHLWCRGLMAIAEVALMLDFANLGVGYARFPFPARGLGRGRGGGGGGGGCAGGGDGGGRARLVHAAALAGPLAWVFVALFWCGAAMLGAHSVGARLFANLAIWLWLLFGGFFVIGYRDYILGFSLSVLSAALGIQQLLIKVLALQWIFAFVVMGLLSVASTAMAGIDIAAVTKKMTNGETNTHHITGETAPLLRDGSVDI